MATDLSQLLRRQGLDFEPTQVAWERVVDGAARRRRNRRVGSALVAIVLFAVSDAALLGVLRSSPGGQAPARGYLNPTTGSSVVVPGGGGAGSIPGEDQQVGGAGGLSGEMQEARSKSMYSRTFSWAVSPPAAHSFGKRTPLVAAF